MRNAPNLPTASSLGQVPHSVGRPWTNTNRTARFCEGPPMLVLPGPALLTVGLGLVVLAAEVILGTATAETAA